MCARRARFGDRQLHELRRAALESVSRVGETFASFASRHRRPRAMLEGLACGPASLVDLLGRGVGSVADDFCRRGVDDFIAAARSGLPAPANQHLAVGPSLRIAHRETPSNPVAEKSTAQCARFRRIEIRHGDSGSEAFERSIRSTGEMSGPFCEDWGNGSHDRFRRAHIAPRLSARAVALHRIPVG